VGRHVESPWAKYDGNSLPIFVPFLFILALLKRNVDVVAPKTIPETPFRNVYSTFFLFLGIQYSLVLS
jgi:hypothetical protein